MDEINIAEVFNNYFSRVATDLESIIAQTSFDPLSSNLMPHNITSIFLRPVIAEKCVSTIQSLKKTECDINIIPVSLLKANAFVFVPII